MNDIFVKCTYCKNDKNIIHYMKNGRQLKLCEDCRIYNRNIKRKNDARYFCSCGKRKTHCIIHGGSALCPCNKVKRYCVLHNGNGICPCGQSKKQCKIHGNTRKITIKNMIQNSKFSDKKFNRFDENQFIDRQFVSNLLDLYENCIYCNCKLNFDKRNPKLATIERLDNTLGHIKRNCVVACFNCNINHVGDKYN